MIVRKEAKGYGTANRIEGAFEPGERVCLVEDVVTSGGAALEAVEALREAGLRVSTRFASSTARKAAPTRSPAPPCGSVRSFSPRSSATAPRARMVERYPIGLLGFFAKV